MKYSLIIPVMDEEENIEPLLQEITNVFSIHCPNEWEVLLIDDGSRDKTWDKILEAKNKYSNIRAWRFQFNCGKAAALNLGFEEAKGDFVATMDGDLQDDPKELPLMEKMIDEGFDLVSGWKKKRHDPIHKTAPSKLFNLVVSVVAGQRLHDFNCGLKLYKKDVIKHLHLYGDYHRFIPVMASWRGFKITEKIVQHRPRIHGVSKYGWSRLISGFLDLISLLFLQFFSKKPLHLFGSLGLVIFGIGSTIMAWFAMTWIQTGNLHVRPLLVIGTTAVVTGIQFMMMGLLGEMIVNRSAREVPPIKNFISGES